MKLIKIKDNIGYIENSCNVGCIIDDNNVILIDSGLEDSAAKKIIKLLNNESYKIKAIINTHSHADHCGGNYYIQNKLNSLIYAPQFESAIIENPYLEPIYLSSGAAPLKELTNKFIMAKPSKVDFVIKNENTKLHIDSAVFDVVQLHGHTVNHIGIATDDILYCGDSILSGELIAKHKIPFNINIEEQFKTLNFLKESSYEVYIPSHSNPMDKKQLIDVVDLNIRTLKHINNTIIKSLNNPKTTDEIEYIIFNCYNIKIQTLTQYYLLKTTILAHINYLYSQKVIRKTMTDNKLYWKLASYK